MLGQVELQNLLVSEGWDFVGIHYRGYPGSSGAPSEKGLEKDALAAWRFVTDVLDTDASRIALHGRSLGGGVAAPLAAKAAPGALVLESTFTSIVDLAKEHYPFLPMGHLLEHRFMTKALASDVSCPVLVAHGSRDSIIDVRHGKELARVFRAVEYIEVPGIDHNEVLFSGPVAMRYLRFLEGAIPSEQKGSQP